MRKILIIDDETDICLLISGILEDEGYEVRSAHTSHGGLELIKEFQPDLVIQDIWLQGSQDDGIDILRSVKKEHQDLPFLMISGHGTIETAVSSIKQGAYDFIEKPFKSDRLLLMIQRALETYDLKKQNLELRKRAQADSENFATYLPDSALQILDKCAKTNSRVLITGEIGTGKLVAAQYLHQNSPRAHEDFIKIDCRSEENFKNRLSTQSEGSVLFDEVQYLSVGAQAQLLVFLQTTPLRVIATCSDDIEQRVAEGTFREDLYYRLNVVAVNLPALRERKKEFQKFIQQSCDFKFSDMAMAKFLSYGWPGNLKQLLNVLEWVSIMHDGDNSPICVDQLPPEFDKNIEHDNNASASIDEAIMQLPLREARERFERSYLLTQVHKFEGNISKTAEFIGMERSALHRKLKSLEVFSDGKQDVA